jgi:hypothetical protein
MQQHAHRFETIATQLNCYFTLADLIPSLALGSTCGITESLFIFT